MKTKDWWSHVVAIEVESFQTKDEMLDREESLVTALNPVYNDTWGIGPALTAAADLLDRRVTREDVRDFVRSKIKVQVVMESDPTTCTLRDYASARGLDLGRLRDWKRRASSSWPQAVRQGPNRTDLYAWEDLDAFVAQRLREPVEDVS